MEQSLITLLESFGYPVRRQGSISGRYPATFLTIWCDGSPDHAYYDNRPFGTAWQYSIYIYSSVPDVLFSLTEAVRQKLMDAGWTVPSKGSDAPSDEPSHAGKSITAYYLEI